MSIFGKNYYNNGKPVGERVKSADVEASERREAAAAAAAAKGRDRRIRQWQRDVAQARAEVIRLEAIPEAKRNARKLRQAKKHLKDLLNSHG